LTHPLFLDHHLPLAVTPAGFFHLDTEKLFSGKIPRVERFPLRKNEFSFCPMRQYQVLSVKTMYEPL
jgi:hypothetical protein